MCKRLKGLVGAAALALGGASAEGAIIVDFIPTPLSPGLKEFEWPSLKEGPGAIGGNDVLPPANASLGGLRIDIPFVMGALPGSQVNLLNGSTTIFDVTMDLE